MAYSTKNCMVSAAEAKKIREREKTKQLRFEAVRRTFKKMVKNRNK